jgi:sporulation protein YlmC with PRC-barrel domain
MKNVRFLKGLLIILITSGVPLHAGAQVAGVQPVGISVSEAELIVRGWSVKKSFLGKPVVNDDGEQIGVVHDIIIAPDASASYVIVAAHQFAGISQHDVAIPVSQLDFVNEKLTLAGGTRGAIKAMPTFQYARVSARPPARSEYSGH